MQMIVKVENGGMTVEALPTKPTPIATLTAEMDGYKWPVVVEHLPGCPCGHMVSAQGTRMDVFVVACGRQYVVAVSNYESCAVLEHFDPMVCRRLVRDNPVDSISLSAFLKWRTGGAA